MDETKASPDLEGLQKLVQSLAYFADLGVEHYILTPARRQGATYRALAARPLRRPGSAPPAAATPAPRPETQSPAATPAAPRDGRPPETAPVPAPPAPRPVQASLLETPAAPLVRLSREEKTRLLAALREEIGDCTRCKLCQGRRTIVFGEGNPDAALMFVGEGPGGDEDATGRPFVGRAGQLLDRMIRAMALRREDVYIANVVKCRPPGNRTPESDEIATCGPFLVRQIEIIQPKVIVCLGATPAQFLFNSRKSIGLLRGTVGRFHGAQVIPTYHPAYLLRESDKQARPKTWADLQKAMAILGLKRPPKSV